MNKLTAKYLTESQEILQIDIPLEGKLKTLSTIPNYDGEFIAINDDKKSITLKIENYQTTQLHLLAQY